MTILELEDLKEGDILIRLDSNDYYTAGTRYTVCYVRGRLGTYNHQLRFIPITSNHIHFKLWRKSEKDTHWWKNCKPGDLIKCHAEPTVDNIRGEGLPPGGKGFEANRIGKVKRVDVYNNRGYAIIVIERNDNKMYGILHTSCDPIEIKPPNEGKLAIDDLDNWRYVQEYLLQNNTRREANGGVKGVNYIVWTENLVNYWKINNHSELKEVTIEDCIVYKHYPQLPQTPPQPKTSTNLNSHTDGRKQNQQQVIKIERLVPRITVGNRPTGVGISGRTRQTAISSRCISDTASVISC